jgi:hypothetical protein
MTTVGKLLGAPFLAARQRHHELHGTWIRISHRVGSRLPASALVVSIQREGEADLVLRCMEEEYAVSNSNEADLFALHYLNLLSVYWVGGMYETFRLLRERGLDDKNDRFTHVLRDLELLRMPLEKHEIAKDRLLKQPATLVRHPSRSDPSDAYAYAISDSKRAHIMPMGISARGSVTWHVIDLRGGDSRWVERRWLSDEIIELWKNATPPLAGSP